MIYKPNGKGVKKAAILPESNITVKTDTIKSMFARRYIRVRRINNEVSTFSLSLSLCKNRAKGALKPKKFNVFKYFFIVF